MADKPSLRFADGGSLITRWARSVAKVFYDPAI